MKIGMRRLHLFILLFVTCSLLFHAPLPEASAAVGDITPIRIKNHAAFESASDNFEYDTEKGTYTNYSTFVQVDPEQSVYTMSIDPESEMDPEPEIEMDPEPEQTKKEKSKRPR